MAEVEAEAEQEGVADVTAGSFLILEKKGATGRFAPFL